MRLLAAAGIAFLMSCTPKPDLKAAPPPAAQTGPSWEQLKGGAFRLQSLKRNGKTVTLPEKVRSTAEFSGEDRVGGSAGVNRYSVQAVVSAGGRIRWTAPAISTRMAGPAELMAMEAAFLGGLAESTRIQLKGNTLILSTEDGGTQLVMSR